VNIYKTEKMISHGNKLFYVYQGVVKATSRNNIVFPYITLVT